MTSTISSALNSKWLPNGHYPFQINCDVFCFKKNIYLFILCRISELNERDRQRKEKEIAQNTLETFILDTSDKLSQPEFESLTTEKERNKILTKCSQVRR